MRPATGDAATVEGLVSLYRMPFTLHAVGARSGEVAWRRYLWFSRLGLGSAAVTGQRVYVATSSLAGARSGHQPGLMALDRKTGAVCWRYLSSPGAAGPFGFPGSPAVGPGLVFVCGLDGKVYAFRQ